MQAQPLLEPEPHVGLTALLGPQLIDWKDINRCCDDILTAGGTLRGRRGLGKKVGNAGSHQHTEPDRIRGVAMLLASAYNGMLTDGHHLTDLGSDQLAMKNLRECKALDLGLLPDDPIQNEHNWAAQVPPGRYPCLMLADWRDANGRRQVLKIKMWRFVCYLARGPPEAVEQGEPEPEVCHACSNTWCVRPSHLRWDSHRRNMQEKTPKRKRR